MGAGERLKEIRSDDDDTSKKGGGLIEENLRTSLKKIVSCECYFEMLHNSADSLKEEISSKNVLRSKEKSVADRVVMPLFISFFYTFLRMPENIIKNKLILGQNVCLLK